MRNVISDVFRQHWQDDIPIQFWEPLWQHCTGFLSMKCCPKNIKRTLNRIFSYAVLSGAWRTTLQKVFFCSPRKYSWDNITQIKTFGSVVREAPNNIAQEKVMCNLVLKRWDNIAQVKTLCNASVNIYFLKRQTDCSVETMLCRTK